MKTIYLLQAGENGPVRIAMLTGTAVERMQAANAAQLIVVAIYEGDRDDVRALHEHHAEHLIRADWFDPAVLDDPPEHLREIDFDRFAQERRLEDDLTEQDARRAELQLASLLARAHEAQP